jgi:tetratricopeptide (TPR) repeat protein
MAWTALGDCKCATELCAEADRLSVGHSSQSRALWALARAHVHLETGQSEDCAAALDEAEALFSNRSDEGGQFLVSWLRALLLVRQGDAATALARLEALQNHPVVARHADLRASLLESRLQAAVELSDEARIEQLRGYYELLRVRYPSLVRDLTVYRTLARVYVKRSDWSKAERAYRQAILAAQHLRGSLLAQDRERFLRCQEPLLQEAAACLQHAGKEGEAEELRQAFAGPKALKRARLLAREYWNRRYHRSGLALGLMNLICGFAAVILAFVAWPSPPRLEGRDAQAFILAAGVILSAAGVVAGGCWAAFRLLERPTTAVRGAGGPLTLVLGAVPWVVLLLLALTRW